MDIDSVADFATGRPGSAYRSDRSTAAQRKCWLGLLLASMGAACSKAPPLSSDDQPRVVPVETAFAIPDISGPEVTAVVERRYANATEQDVLLATSAATSGQNMLRIQIFGPVDTAVAGRGTVRPGYLPLENISAEMRKQVPGVRMRTSAFYVQNKYGPFGYAFGQSSQGDTCFYGWQRISSTGLTQTWVGNKGSIQVRLRLCSDSTSEQGLLQAMYGYTINSSFKDRNWNPYGEPLPPDESFGRGGAPIYPEGKVGVETAAEPIAEAPPAPAPKRRASSKRQAAAVASPPELPAPIGPVVPPPPGSGPSTAARTVPVPPPESTSPRAATPVVPLPPCTPESTEQRCN